VSRILDPSGILDPESLAQKGSQSGVFVAKLVMPEAASGLILRRPQRGRLEGWPRAHVLYPSFETHRFAMLLRMRSELEIPIFRNST
jgi:hypothetical protein